MHIGGPPHATHASNKIKTSLYTILNFVPLNLFKQFHRVANVWFFLICCLQTIKSISVTDGKPSTALGLVFVMFVTMVKDAIEDISRHKADGVENGRAAHRRNPQSAGECPWQEVQTGDLIVVRNREFIPADLVLLATSNDQGQCHVMTANLDGETNLKLRQVASGLLTHQPAFVPDANVARAREPAGALQVLGSILCESPNKHLSRFDGTFVAEGGEKLPLGPNNVVLRGTMLRNTSWALGVAVYTGRQTKIQQNAAQPPFKMSRLGKIVDRTLLFVFLSEIFFCLLAYGIGRSWWSRAFNFFEPLGGVGRDAEWDGFLRFMTYVLVFTNYIPISLLVTQDMVKFAQAFFMNWDLRMYYERTDTPAKVRCADLNEELGMIDHIFSDKTGTLTCNVMAYRKCSISGKSYGESVQAGQSFTDPHVLFDDDSLKRVLTDSGYRGIVADFWTNLMLNHTVQAEYPHAQGQGQERGAPVYSAASPDELAFVRAAAHQGFVFEANAPKALICKVDGRPVTYDVLHVLEFNSDRKRSSVVARERHEGSDANGNTMRSSIKLLTKGADNVIIPLLHADFTTPGGAKTRLLDQTNADILRYSKDGLRTLMITTRTVPDDFYEQWSKRYHEAETAVQGRRQKMERIMAEMERDLELVGATAIEDKLQDGVVQTISALRNAGIKIWVLTGDKVDTAISISMSAALLTEKMHILRLVGQDGGMDSDSHGVPTADALKGEFAKFELETANHAKDKVYALVADSLALEAIDREHMGNELMSVCAKCKSVVCARVTPDQKGMIVRLAQDTDARPVTLAIGDGANDVNMIQKAHIGVGIAGEEGLQAVNNSDYAIAQFRFLANLVIVHGRWSVRRMVEVSFFINCFFRQLRLTHSSALPNCFTADVLHVLQEYAAGAAPILLWRCELVFGSASVHGHVVPGVQHVPHSVSRYCFWHLGSRYQLLSKLRKSAGI